ncbi:hypothetical protein [Halorubrum sp. DTA46]|uniref:hypothetical protein n=1 Tax=Halorubrum sp. DTA46 TaxID=3402162 RepID=UPI003AAD299A
MVPDGHPSPAEGQPLVRRLRAELGEYFKFAVAYDTADSRVLYRSPAAGRRLNDCAGEDSGDLHSLVDRFRSEERYEGETQPVDLGEHRCSLHLYSEWLLLHYRAVHSGVVVGVDAESAANLREFLEDISPAVSRTLSA